jgi:hypothetical protein
MVRSGTGDDLIAGRLGTDGTGLSVEGLARSGTGQWAYGIAGLPDGSFAFGGKMDSANASAWTSSSVSALNRGTIAWQDVPQIEESVSGTLSDLDIDAFDGNATVDTGGGMADAFICVHKLD